MEHAEHREPVSAEQPRSEAAAMGGGPPAGARLPALGRRQFFTLAGGTTAAIVAAGSLPGSAGAAPGAAAASPRAQGDDTRRDRAYRIRHDAARYHYDLPPTTHRTNGDEERYPTRIGSYSKALPHNDRGEVDPAAYDALLAALRSGALPDFLAVPRGGGTIRSALPRRSRTRSRGPIRTSCRRHRRRPSPARRWRARWSRCTGRR
jgi:hypothetical protein